MQEIEQALQGGYLSAEAAASITAWLTNPKYEEYKAELNSLIEKKDWKTLEDSFFKVLPFGTGGRRGTVGIGSNRINKVTIGESAQGLAAYLKKKNPGSLTSGVVVAYDTRLTSQEFAEYTASVLAANGFKVYLFESWRATPELSFAVRHLYAAAGVVISASHNPPADNGFKAYWQDGGQVVAPHDAGILEQVAAVETIHAVALTDAIADKKIQMIGEEVDVSYVDAVTHESLAPSRSAKIVYSPLHGTGMRSALPVLRAAGFADITVVEEQATPDGAFPNVKNHSPNPELRDTALEVTALAKQLEADIAITTDPDADRLGVIARNDNGEYEFLTGNQIAALLGHFVLAQLDARGKLAAHQFIVKTIVTTDFLRAFAREFEVKIYDEILIGFKYVAELIATHEGKEQFLFGGEESHGILKGTYTRDKDAAVAALLMAELASTLKDEGNNVVRQLFNLYRQYGVYVETLQNIQYPGADGNRTMQKLMSGLRQKPFVTIGSEKVHEFIDRAQSTAPLAKGDVLIFILSKDGQNRITVRPSGTEPKLKIYVQLHQPADQSGTDETIRQQRELLERQAAALTQALNDEFTKIVG